MRFRVAPTVALISERGSNDGVLVTADKSQLFEQGTSATPTENACGDECSA